MTGFINSSVAVIGILALETCSSPRAPLPPAAPELRTNTRSSDASCAKPTDAAGRALYEMVRGAFVNRRIDSGGARFIELKPVGAAAPQAVVVSSDVYDTAGRLEAGHSIALFGYVTNADAGSHPTFSCIEF